MMIKICGLTRTEDARYLNEEEVDFAGMVLFFPKSRRNITITEAKKIMAELKPEIRRVAVTVSPSPEEIREIETAGFDLIQIHGKLEKEVLQSIQIPVLKAFNISDLTEYEKFSGESKIAGYVFDALTPGSGKIFDWDLVKELPRDGKLLILAGGLNAENVKEAIRCLKPDAVDVSSGVETGGIPGKDQNKIHQFVKAVKEA